MIVYVGDDVYENYNNRSWNANIYYGMGWGSPFYPWYDPWYDPWFYGGYYSPWHYSRWYSPWYYSSWYSPWYHSRWYSPWYMEDGMIRTMDMAVTLMVAVITMVLTMDITAV